MERVNVKLVQKNWKFIDEHVLKISERDERDFDSLVAFFNQPIESRLDRDIFMTRAIIYWMHHCGSRETWPQDLTPDTPLGMMKKIKDRRMSRQDAFMKLCKAAGIECQCIHGIAKLSGFQPGQKDLDKFKVTWNKVKLEGSWWPVFPDWILQSVARDGHSIIKTLTDFWFLTDPEIFIYKCYPDKAEDQMLPVHKQVKNVRKFTKLPLLSYHFFRHNFRLTSEQSSLLDADDGKCTVSFKVDSALARTLNFQPKLVLPNTEGKEITYDPSRLVFNSRRKGQFFFEVRCPVLGYYRLEVRGGPLEEQPKLYITAQIECLEVVDNVQELPIDAGVSGWGFGPVAESAGLSRPTVKDPKMEVTLQANNPGSNIVKFGFNLDGERADTKRFEAKLVESGHGEDEFDDDVEINRTTGSLEVKVQLRYAGEYALSILASDKSDNSDRTIRVCNYLISTIDDPVVGSEEYEDSSDGFSELDEENFELEREVEELEAKYNELLLRSSSSLSLFPPQT